VFLKLGEAVKSLEVGMRMWLQLQEPLELAPQNYWQSRSVNKGSRANGTNGSNKANGIGS
jgi:hypothetical protein